MSALGRFLITKKEADIAAFKPPADRVETRATAPAINQQQLLCEFSEWRFDGKRVWFNAVYSTTPNTDLINC
jgi:hypothetical protein